MLEDLEWWELGRRFRGELLVGMKLYPRVCLLKAELGGVEVVPSAKEAGCVVDLSLVKKARRRWEGGEFHLDEWEILVSSVKDLVMPI